ncbi:Gp15 family bacteriophage protein [Virgibacillus oceani]
MRLNDNLVTSFVYNEKEYNINLAFDTVLDTFDVLSDNTLRDHEKAEINLELLLNEPLEGVEAIELWNYIYDEFIDSKSSRPIEYDLNNNPMPVQEDEKENFIDFEQDAGFIYSSFLQAYQMDLYKLQGKLHWSLFRSLLHGLPQSTIMQRIVQIRAWKPSKGDSSEYKQQMRELQKEYALEEVDE